MNKKSRCYTGKPATDIIASALYSAAKGDVVLPLPKEKLNDWAEAFGQLVRVDKSNNPVLASAWVIAMTRADPLEQEQLKDSQPKTAEDELTRSLFLLTVAQELQEAFTCFSNQEEEMAGFV
jgi:hypothetical protein